MRGWFVVLCLLCGCGETTLEMSFEGHHRVLFQTMHKQLSCRGARCCAPYQKPVIICTEPTLNDVGITIEYQPDK